MVFYGVFLFTSVCALVLSGRWVGLLAAVVQPFVGLPVALFVFYKGYFGAALGRGFFTFYKVGETCVICVGEFIRIFRLLLFALFFSRAAFYCVGNGG